MEGKSPTLGKKWVMKLIFCIKISMTLSYKLMLWFLMGMVKHFRRYQNSKFVMSLQYLKKEVRNEVDFLHADKHQSLLQIDINTLKVFKVFKVFKVTKFSARWYCHYWWALFISLLIKHSQSTQKKVLQWLYNISQMKLVKAF